MHTELERISRRCRTLLVLVAIALAAGCSLDYDAGRIAEERPEELPETILFESSYTIERRSDRVLRFTAERAESYPEQNTQLLFGLTFTERNADGEVLSSGNADRATYFTDSDNVELSGGIRFRAETESAEVQAEYLFWNDEEDRLTSREDERVTVVRDSGSKITGLGFEADTRLKRVSFTGEVSGTLVTDDSEEGSDSTTP